MSAMPAEAMGYDYEAMRKYVGKGLHGLVVKRRNPERKIRPRLHGALYIFEINRELLSDVPSLLKELGHSKILERRSSKKRG